MPRKAAAPKATAAKRPGKKLNKIKGASRTFAVPPHRASVYDPERHPERVRRMGLLGLTDIEMCFQLGISEATFYAWKKRYTAFLKALESGKGEADEIVAETMFNLATGRVRQPAVKVFYDKDKGEAVYAPYVEAIPPNVTAQKLWLTNRQPHKWRERKEVEVSGGIEHKISLMSPAERLQRLLELQKKAADIIDAEAVDVTPDDEAE